MRESSVFWIWSGYEETQQHSRKSKSCDINQCHCSENKMKKNAYTEYTAFTLGEQWSPSPTIVKLCVTLQKYLVIYHTVWNCSSSAWNWTSQVLTWTRSWVNLTKPAYSFSSRNEEFKWTAARQHTFSRRKDVQTARICSRPTVSSEQVFGRGLPCSQRCCLSQQEAGSRRPSDQLCKMKEI